MSVRIRVSYEREQEIRGVLHLLSPVVKRVRIQPNKGRYKRAYIEAEEASFPPVLAPVDEAEIAEIEKK